MSRRARRWVIALVVLVALLVVADRVAAQVAEGYAERELQSTLETPSRPDVELRGFPALPQLIRQELGSVRIEAEAVPTDRLVVDSLQADLDDVVIDRSARTVTAGTLDGSALIGWDDLETASGVNLELTALPDGQVQVERTIEVLGLQVRLRGSVTVSVVSVAEGSAVRIQATSAEVVDPIGFSVPGRLVDLLSATVPVTGLPAGILLEDVVVSEAGVVAEVSGSDVTFS